MTEFWHLDISNKSTPQNWSKHPVLQYGVFLYIFRMQSTVILRNFPWKIRTFYILNLQNKTTSHLCKFYTSGKPVLCMGIWDLMFPVLLLGEWLQLVSCRFQTAVTPPSARSKVTLQLVVCRFLTTVTPRPYRPTTF